jgi:hypothetical protein
MLPTPVFNYLESFVQTFLFIFQQSLFQPTGAEIEQFFVYNDVISNVVRMTSVRTTDVTIRLLLSQGSNAGKILVLLNPRCDLTVISHDEIRRTVPALFGKWFMSWYSMAFSGLAEATVFNNLFTHQRYLAQLAPGTPDALYDVRAFLPLYFASTYVDDESEAAARQHIRYRRASHLAALLADARPGAVC